MTRNQCASPQVGAPASEGRHSEQEPESATLTRTAWRGCANMGGGEQSNGRSTRQGGTEAQQSAQILRTAHVR
jgi:hypothetical protein